MSFDNAVHTASKISMGLKVDGEYYSGGDRQLMQ